MESRSWHCPPCDEVREFVQPACPDGHADDGGECPEWICAECGGAFVIGEVGVVSDVPRLRHAA